MLDPAFRFSSNWCYSSEEYDRLKLFFSRLKYPDKHVSFAFSRFMATKASDQPDSSTTVSDWTDPILVVLPFKDQAPADIVRFQLKDLNRKSTRPYSLYLSARGPNKILGYEKRSHRLWTNSALFMNLNRPVRCRLCWFYTPPSAPTCSRTQKFDFVHWQAFSRKVFFGPRGSCEEF